MVPEAAKDGHWRMALSSVRRDFEPQGTNTPLLNAQVNAIQRVTASYVHHPISVLQ